MIPSCPECGHQNTHCVDWTESTIEYSCPDCGCYFDANEDPIDREPIVIEWEDDAYSMSE